MADESLEPPAEPIQDDDNTRASEPRSSVQLGPSRQSKAEASSLRATSEAPRLSQLSWFLVGGTGPAPSWTSFERRARQRVRRGKASDLYNQARREALAEFERGWGVTWPLDSRKPKSKSDQRESCRGEQAATAADAEGDAQSEGEDGVCDGSGAGNDGRSIAASTDGDGHTRRDGRDS